VDRGERQGIIGQMRVAAIEMGDRIWVIFLWILGEVFVKKRRIELRKGRKGWGRPRGREKETIKARTTNARPR
jgi:hypothetical protein